MASGSACTTPATDTKPELAKARTEKKVKVLMKQGAPLSILRLAKVISPQMQLLKGWVETLATGHPIRAFQDTMVSPTPIRTVTEAIVCA